MTKQLLQEFVGIDLDPVNPIAELKAANIYIYGGGVMARGLIRMLKAEGINLNGAFVDHEFYHDAYSIDGVPVMDMDELFAELSEPIVVVMGMSAMEKGLEIQDKFNIIKKVVYIPAVSSKIGGGRLTKQDYLLQREQFQALYETLEDDCSRECLTAWINANILADVTKILPLCKGFLSYFKNDVVNTAGDKTFFDVGAYTVDTIEEYLKTNPKVERIWAFEGVTELCDRITSHYTELIGQGRLHVHQCVLWSDAKKIVFSQPDVIASGGKNVVERDGQSIADEIMATTLDAILADRAKPVDFVKVNVLSPEEILRGAKKLLKEDHPKIAVKIWYEWTVLFRLCALLRNDFGYKLYLRFRNANTDGLILFAI